MLKCGLEIHQRLATKHKLFCNCPPVMDEKSDKTIRRKLRAVVGELGIVDRAAAFQAQRGMTFVYDMPEKSSCLIECDDEPPRELNREALETVLSITKALHAKPVDEVHMMRKIVVDGSAVSAFQRTALIATDGWLETTQGRVEIPTICLEEESSGIIEKKDDEIFYSLDRLGIPLIEIATDPSIKSGSHAREVAEQIGLLLRLSGRVQRGIGTIRQDLNVSIPDGARVEIKGAQELKDLASLVDNEVLRQQGLVAIIQELQARRAEKKEFRAKSVTHVFKDAKGFVGRAITDGATAMAMKLENFAGLPGRELLKDYRFGSELSDYAKAKAGVGGIIHSDENPEKYGLANRDFARVAAELGCSGMDAWIVCVADETKAIKALEAVFERAYILFVPEETRRADGILSRYLRPLPGNARMYPETDVLPVPTESLFAGVKAPMSIGERKATYLKMGLGPDLADKLLRSSEFALFDRITSECKKDPTLIAATLLETFTALRREGLAVDGISFERLQDLFGAYEKNRIVKAAVAEALKSLAASNSSVEEIISEKSLAKLSLVELEKITMDEIQKVGKERAFGEVMRKYRLNVNAEELKAIL